MSAVADSSVLATATTAVDVVILIPAYEPDVKMIRLLAAIRAEDPTQPVVIVDDGSGPDYASVFDAARALGCDVIGHPTNRGKGVALKVGFAHVADRYPGLDVVCADCDGQHSLADIDRVGEMLRDHRAGPVLGARQFVGDVPRKSRFGNDLTRFVFRLTTGLRLQDTQTGLRGYPAWMLPWLQSIDGDRFEYELDVLLAVRSMGFALREVPIETIYIEGNASSHFDPVRDSIRVYLPFLKFSMSSLVAFAVDTVVFFAVMALTHHLALAVVVARLVSATTNFVVNRRVVFADRRTDRVTSAWRYGLLATALLALNYGALFMLTDTLSTPLVPAKFATEIALFVVSYQIQRRVVFDVDTSAQRVATIPSELCGVPLSPARFDEFPDQCTNNPNERTCS
jgi:putative flippase GtrA